jgi:hypothetical protein
MGDRIIGLYGIGLGILVFAAMLGPGTAAIALPLYAGIGFCAAGAVTLLNPVAARRFLEQRQPLRWAGRLLQSPAAGPLTLVVGFLLLLAGLAIAWAALAGRFALAD